MKPILIKITGHTGRSSQEVCAEFLKTERWSEFKGYLFLPGIKKAEFELKTPGVLGSRIKVYNTDGSTHIEEVIKWDVENQIALRFDAFQPPLQNLATHFIETLRFKKSDGGTDIERSMVMYPKGLSGQILLLPISRLMKKSLERNIRQLS
jgi:hypothetical protein